MLSATTRVPLIVVFGVLLAAGPMMAADRETGGDDLGNWDAFGRTLAAGDFNGDGVSDLAVGVPKEDFTYGGKNLTNAGTVNIMYGIKNLGLSALNRQIWSQGSSGVIGMPEAWDAFGHSLAVYPRQINDYLTYYTEERPFPFDRDWPDGD